MNKNTNKPNRRNFIRWLFGFVLLTFAFTGRRGMTQTKGDDLIDGLNKIKPKELKRNSTVLRVQSEGVISDNFDPDSYLETIRTDKLDEMLEEGIKGFAREKNVKEAWYSILTDYKAGDKIAIKPNFNHVEKGYKFTIPSPQLINSVVKQLVEVVGVKPNEIFLYDLCIKIPSGIVRSIINYPINYVERANKKSILDKIKLRMSYGLASPDKNAEISMRKKIVNTDGSEVKCYMPRVVTQCLHIINMPLMTNHIFVSNSGALKNHYGTVRFSNYSQYPGVLHGDVLNKSIVDINNNLHIKKKTRIIIADGIFGVFDRGEGKGKKKWNTFSNNFPKSIFISNDSVAVDSIMASFVLRERKTRQMKLLSAEYLKDAEKNGLGVCEINMHNDKFKKIKYSTITL